jgi:adenine-specific DNA-methyltransferase
MKKEIPKVNKISEDLLADKIAGLKRIIPEVFSENKIDWEKLKLTLDGEIDNRLEKYGLSWAGKSEAFRAIRIPATGTLVPQEKESKEYDKTQNIFIEGDNLEALKLLQKHYREKIKMIYIDPPYNTGKDFIYKDNFTEGLSDYYERTGQAKNGVKMTSNLESNGRYHSDWLTMMYPRLFMARNLLREDGVIFISVDDNEVHNLRMIMDEIFGEENFVEAFIWRSRLGKGSTSTETATIHEYIICYAKEIEKVDLISDIRIKKKETKERLRQWGQGDKRQDRPTMYYSVYSKEFGDVFPKKADGTDGRWRLGKNAFDKLIEQNLVIFEKQENERIEAYKIIPVGSETETAQSSILDDDIVKTTAHGTKEINNLLAVKIFDYPKPTTLIKFLVRLVNDKDFFVLDFFAGSGTTAHAVMDLNADGGNRKWICVQIPEEVDEKSEAKKAGFNTIAEIARERIRRAAAVI